MQSSNANPLTEHQWKIPRFSRFILDNNSIPVLQCRPISLKGSTGITFSLYFDHQSQNLAEAPFGILFRDLGGKASVTVDMDMWLENENGDKFAESSVKEVTFHAAGQKQCFAMGSQSSFDLFQQLVADGSTLKICCCVRNLGAFSLVSVLPDGQHQVGKKLWSLYERGVHDTVLKIGAEEFKVHKHMFMAFSEVFERKFSSGSNAVTIEDISAPIMRVLIRWLYLGEIKLADEQIEDLYQVASLYKIDELMAQCSDCICTVDSLSDDAICKCLVFAVLHKDAKLKKHLCGLMGGKSSTLSQQRLSKAYELLEQLSDQDKDRDEKLKEFLDIFYRNA